MLYYILSITLNFTIRIPCGELPKQVSFSCNEKFIVITPLNATGIQVADIEKKRVIRTVGLGSDYRKCSFVEVLFVPGTDTFFVSQMKTGKIFKCFIDSSGEVIQIKDFNSYGTWPKVMALSPEKRFLAVSNWLSNEVSILSYNSGTLLKKLKTKNPRGVSFTPNGKFLLIASFGDGDILKVSTENWKVEGKIHVERAAMRHIVVRDENTFYVSDMFHGRVYEVSVSPFKITGSYKVYRNPNTIDISPDKKFLFVSCRGPNSKEGYLKRSPSNGKVYVINLVTGKTEIVLNGGNQPTGLDVSPEGKYLAFSNFRDNNVEVYRIEP